MTFHLAWREGVISVQKQRTEFDKHFNWVQLCSPLEDVHIGQRKGNDSVCKAGSAYNRLLINIDCLFT